MPSIPRLVEMGAIPIVAREIVNQFAGTIVPSAGRYIEHGVPVVMARELAAQATGAKSASRLVEAGMAPDLAREVVT